MAATLIRRKNEEGVMENLFFKTEEIYVPIADTEDTEKQTFCTVSLVDDELKNTGADMAHYQIGIENYQEYFLEELLGPLGVHKF